MSCHYSIVESQNWERSWESFVLTCPTSSLNGDWFKVAPFSLHDSNCRKLLEIVVNSQGVNTGSDSIFYKQLPIGPTSVFYNFKELSCGFLAYFVLQQFKTYFVSSYFFACSISVVNLIYSIPICILKCPVCMHLLQYCSELNSVL